LRALALAAMEAARAAGADSADIRIGVRRRLTVYPYPGSVVLNQMVGYGVRAWHNGTWSFQHGNVLSADAVAATARSAAAGARLYAGIDAQLSGHRRPVSALTAMDARAALPVVTGAWRTPVEIDPFLVAIDDLQRVMGTSRRMALPDAAWEDLQIHAGGGAASWDAETRVFASTAGSLVTQETMAGGFRLSATAVTPDNRALGIGQSDPVSRPGGFETLLRPGIGDELERLAGTIARWQELPFRAFGDVGRFPVVLDGRTMAQLVGATVGQALDGDRVSGVEDDASGGSFLAPPLDVLQAAAPQFSPLLSARVDRALPSTTAVQWDDDGVVPEPYTVLERGRVVDFHTTCETVPMLASWYARQGRPVRSHGGTVAPTADSVPYGSGGHLRVAPSPASASVDDLMREISHGFLIANGGVSVSPGLTAGRIGFDANDGCMIEIRRGVPVARTVLQLQFTTQSILGRKNLLALGDASTSGWSELISAKGIPWQSASQQVTAPAALCNDVDVIP